MVTFYQRENSIQITTDSDTMVFPKGALMAIASEDSEIVNLRLMASRQNVITFKYTDSEIKGADAVETAKLVSELL